MAQTGQNEDRHGVVDLQRALQDLKAGLHWMHMDCDRQSHEGLSIDFLRERKPR